MHNSLDEQWNLGRQAEAAGDMALAERHYAALLARNDRHIPALLRMSRFAQAKNRYRAARQHALQAADAARLERSTRHLAFVTRRLLDFAEDAEVASVALSADWADPDILRQSPSLAQHLWLAGRYHDALRFLDAVAARVPAHPLLLLTRADVLQYLGRVDEAADGYERCLRHDPNLADAHWALAKQSPGRDTQTRVARIGQSMRHHPADSIERTQLDYALFHELDAAGQTEAAWAALAHGAACMRGRLRFDAPAAHARIAMAMRDASTDVVPPADERPPQPCPIFILGLPRTGTTLLDRMLGNHGWVSSAGERNDFNAAVSETLDRFFGGLEHEADLQALAHIDHRRVGHHYLQRLRRLASATAFAIDKNPQNLFNLPLILRALPHARIVCVTRAPMDAAFSNLKELFQGGAYPYSYDFADLAAQVTLANRWMRFWAAHAPASVRVVEYESLVGATDATLAALLDFIGLPAAQGLGDVTRNASPVSTASSAQVRKPVHAGNIGAWRRYAQPLEPLRQLLEGAPA